MDQTTNYLGATIFWLYIVAALAFTALIIHTLIDLPHPKGVDESIRNRNIKVFATLALISFATLSFNMLHVLIQSFALWIHGRELHDIKDLLPGIWHWSLTSTLFHDFGEAIVEDSSGYVWAEAALAATLSVCLYMGIEGILPSNLIGIHVSVNTYGPGRRHRVPRLWAFFCLGQILPISFTQNLFYIAILCLSGNRQVQVGTTSGLVGLQLVPYFCSLFIAPHIAGTAWLMPLILTARGLLLVPLLNFTSTERRSSISGRSNLLQRLQISVAFTGACLVLLQATVTALRGQSAVEIVVALTVHPAVSSLGCDFLLCMLSAVLWSMRDTGKIVDPSMGKQS